MNTFAWVVLAAFAPAAPDEATLAGRWVYKTDFLTVTSTLLPDGRYFAETKVSDTAVPERGKYTVKDGTLTLEPLGGAAVTFTYTLDKDTLVVVTPDRVKLEYQRVATGAEVAAEAKKADAAKAKEDDKWKEKFAVGTMKVQPKHVAAGAVPEDENVKAVFDSPDVFSSQQLYLREGQAEYVFRDGNPPGRFKTYFHWHFLPTGRIYVDATTYTGATEVAKALRGPLPTYYATGKTEQKKFGRYKVEKDEVVIEMDDGEKVKMTLIDGRRNLVWDKAVYGNVTWELGALKKK
jgi:hypothetical protein